MCAVSAIGDYYSDKWKQPGNPLYPYTTLPFYPNSTPKVPNTTVTRFVSIEEFDKLREEVEEMKRILIVAAEYDKRTNQPHCEMEEKVELIKRVADIFGVDLKEIF